MSARPASYDREERHRIGRFVAAFSVAARDGPLSAPERLAQQIRSELLPALEMVVDDPTLAEHDASVELLEIDLGQWPSDPDWPSVREVFRQRLLAALAPYLTGRSDGFHTRSDRDADVIPARQAADQEKRMRAMPGASDAELKRRIVPFDRAASDAGVIPPEAVFKSISGRPGADVFTMLRGASDAGVERFDAALSALPDAAQRRFLRAHLARVPERSAPSVERLKTTLIGLLQRAGHEPATAAHMATTLVARLLLHPVGAHLVPSETAQSVDRSDDGRGIATVRQDATDRPAASQDGLSGDAPRQSGARQTSEAALSPEKQTDLTNPALLRSAWTDDRPAVLAVLRSYDADRLFHLLGPLLPGAGKDFHRAIEHRYAKAAQPKAFLLSVISAVLDNRPVDLDAGNDQVASLEAASAKARVGGVALPQAHEAGETALNEIVPLQDPHSWQQVLSLLRADRGDASPTGTQDDPGTTHHDAARVASETAAAGAKVAVFKHRGAVETGAVANHGRPVEDARIDVPHRHDAPPPDLPKVQGDQSAQLPLGRAARAAGKDTASDRLEQQRDHAVPRDDAPSAAHHDHELPTASPLSEDEPSTAEPPEEIGPDVVFRHGARDLDETRASAPRSDPDSERAAHLGSEPSASVVSPDAAADSDRAARIDRQNDNSGIDGLPGSEAHDDIGGPKSAESDASVSGAEHSQQTGGGEAETRVTPGPSPAGPHLPDVQGGDFEAGADAEETTPGAPQFGPLSSEPHTNGSERGREAAPRPADGLSPDHPSAAASDQTHAADTRRDDLMQAASDAAQISGRAQYDPAVQALVDVTFGAAGVEIDEALALVWSALPAAARRHALQQISGEGQEISQGSDAPEYQHVSAGLQLELIARIGPAADEVELTTVLSHVLDIASEGKEERQQLLRHLTTRLSYPTDLASPVLRQKVMRALEATARTGECARSAEAAETTHPPETSLEQRLLTRNAGLVLFHPFYKLLFTRLELLTSDGRLAADQLGRARAVLTALSGEVDPTLPFDALTRLLLGLNAAVPPPPLESLEEAEQETIDGLIRSVIADWSKLGQTSPAGLQEAFVQRGGQLRFDATGAHLTVDPGPFDVLLDSLPWSVDTMIALPWMPVPCHVVWRSRDG